MGAIYQLNLNEFFIARRFLLPNRRFSQTVLASACSSTEKVNCILILT